MQGQRGLFTTHVDGKVHEFIFSTCDDVWRKRRHVMSPAFSAHKMKLVSEDIKLPDSIHSHVCELCVRTYMSAHVHEP